MAGFFPCRTRDACGKNNLVSKILRSPERKTNKVIDYTFLAGWVTRRCLSSSRRRSASAATCSGVASPSVPNIKVISIGTTNTLGKTLKDQKAGLGEKKIFRKKLQLRLPVTRLSLSPIGALHRLNCLSYKLGDGPRPVVLTYVKLEVTGHLSLLSRSPNGFLIGLPSFQSGTSPQPDSRRVKRKSYFQCFTFDFFSLAVKKPGLLLKQYHPKSPVSLRALWTVYTKLNARAVQVRPRSLQVALKEQTLCHDVGTTCTGSLQLPDEGKSDTVVKSHTINDNALCGRLIHYGIRLGDHEGIPDRQKRVGAPGNSGCSATISATNPLGARPFLLGTDLSGADGPSGDEELVNAPSQDELLKELARLVEATSAPGLDEDRAEQGLPCVPLANSSSGDLMRGVDLGNLWAEETRVRGILAAGPRGSARFKKGHRIRNLFGFPTFILSRDASHHPTIGDHGLPLHLPAAGAPLPSARDQHSSSKPQKLTTSDPPAPILDLWSKSPAPRPARRPRSATWRRMSPAPFQGAQSRPPRPRLQTTKSVGIGHGSLREEDEVNAKLSSSAKQRTPSRNWPSP
ncbi:LOW QUALITY PROTEIN: hypothetical protein Cgig2_021783 [Carnegiea gigantea]|uniref:Uncharacterized protein n=1 Tax=Carnegiea gigantea TaxID=171969 RepID=A0A9Q1GUB4_9CARY|nr:LOW QUALITY PROTEIN: hypothetical protein Cgig2_021783 [Carnegiea gigantea]